MKIHYVFLTTNLVNGKQYIGDHTIDDRSYYIGSGRLFLKAVKKYGKQNFFKEILEWFETREEAFNAQEKYIKEHTTLIPHGYNLSPKGGLRVKGCHSEETKQKISFSNTGKIRTEEQRKRNGELHKGKKVSNEIKQKISNTLLNHDVSTETREKMSKTHKNIKKDWLFTPCPEEKKKKISDTKKLKPFIYTPEIRLKMSLAKKGKSPWNKGLKLTH